MSEKKLTGDPRIDSGWFSRRHETPDAHYASRDARRASHNNAEKAIEILTYRATRSSQEQVAELDRRLGVGQGAVRERARLAKAIATIGK